MEYSDILAFCFKGFQLLPDAIIGFKNTDLAVMYCAVICPFTVLNHVDFLLLFYDCLFFFLKISL